MFIVEARENPSDFYLFLSNQSPKLRVSALWSVCWDKYISQLAERNCLEKSKCPSDKKLCALCVAPGAEHDQLAVQSLPPDPLLEKQRSLSYCPTSWQRGASLLWPHPSCPLPPHLRPPRLPQPPDQSWRLGPVLGAASARPRQGGRVWGSSQGHLFVLMETTQGFGVLVGTAGAREIKGNLWGRGVLL